MTHKDSFNITYAGGNFAMGDYISENIHIGGATVKGQTLGLATRARYWTGLMGLGYTLTEASNNGFDDTPFTYPTLLDEMFDQGLINLKAYSLYLNSFDSQTGSIIFGGMDTDKYIGDLVQMPVITRISSKGTQIYDHFTVAMTSMSVNNGAGDVTLTSSASPVLLDSGTTLSYIPDIVARQLFDVVGATDDTYSARGPNASGFVYVYCNIVNDPFTFTFKFGDSKNTVGITIPISELVYPIETIFGSIENSPYPDDTGDGICVFGINPSIDGMAILGDTFLRSAYVVYDMSNNVVAMAQMNPRSTKENIVDFKESDTTIPGVSKVATGVEVVHTKTFYGGVENVSSGTRVRVLTTSATETASGTATTTGGDLTSVTSSSTSVSTSAPPSSGERIGGSSVMVGLGVSICAVMLSGSLFFA